MYLAMSLIYTCPYRLLKLALGQANEPHDLSTAVLVDLYLRKYK